MKKKVCVVTVARSDYGLLRWVMDGIQHCPSLELQLVVTGGHLAEEQGLTCRQIEADGYPVSAKVDIHLDTATKASIAESTGHCAIGFARAFDKLRPDLIVVLGDRYELMPICGVALVMNIPIAHISGGDVTVGAIDDEIRNAVTMMAELHFPGVQASADNIVRMRNSNKHVWAVGEPGLDNFHRLPLMGRPELSENLQIPLDSKWILVTLHPETHESLEYNLGMAENIAGLLDGLDDVTAIITYANADFGGAQINDFWNGISRRNPQKYRVYPSLGQIRYLSMMKECFAVVGNSSSGILEAPHLGIPVINIGHRQTGRHLCGNILQVNNHGKELATAWMTIEHVNCRITDNYYGDGHASEKIVKYIQEYFDKRI